MKNILTSALSALVHDLSGRSVSALDVSCQCSCPAQTSDITRKFELSRPKRRTIPFKHTVESQLNGQRIFLMVNSCGTEVQILFYLAGHLLELRESHH